MNLAIITGASSGIGKEFYKLMQIEPIDEVWVIARRENALNEICKEYGKLPYKVLPMDLTADDSIEKLQAILENETPTIKYLFNNAGYGLFGEVEKIDYKKQGHMIDLNVKSLTQMTSICLRYMSKGSHIINTCSIASFVPNANLTTYSSTKAYVMSFSRGLSQELKKKKISVTAICPGPMATEFMSVAGLNNGESKKINSLPFCDPYKTARGGIRAAKRGKSVYTPRLFYKSCRLLAKVAPHSILLKIAKA